MNIGIVGATGMIGQRVVTEALNRNHTVTALTHDPTHIPRPQGAVTWKVADVLQADSIAAILPMLDVLVSAYGPGPRSNSSSMRKVKVESLVRTMQWRWSMRSSCRGTCKDDSPSDIEQLEESPTCRTHSERTWTAAVSSCLRWHSGPICR